VNLARQQKIRLGLLFLTVCTFFTIAVARLVHLQVIKHDEYSQIVERQSHGTVSIPATRGLIYDRQGEVVVDNIVLSSLYAYPKSKKQIGEINRYLDRFLGFSAGTSQSKYNLRKNRFSWIKRRLADELAAEVGRTAPPGLFLRQESQRTYPFGLIGKQITGFTDIDNNGQAGLELAFDSMLAGRRGQADVRRDGLQKTFRVQEQALLKPVPGQSIVLTVDWTPRDSRIQRQARRGRIHRLS